MAIKTAAPESVEQAQEMLRAAVKPPRSEVRNVAIAAESEADSYFKYRGTHYKAPPLSYDIGIQLQEILVEANTLGEREERDEIVTEADQKAHMLHLLLCYQRAIALFQRSCYPVAFWKRWWHKRRNPFITCSGGEIGQLLSFFSTCRTKSRVRLLGSSAFRPSLTLSMPPTTSPTSLPISQIG